MDTAINNRSPPKKSRKKDTIEQFLTANQIILKTGLSQLRYMILVDGLKTPQGYDSCPYRVYVWSILLRVNSNNSTKVYLNLVSKGPPLSYSKIKNDTFRTLTKDLVFLSKVSEQSITRVLSAFAWYQEDSTINNNNNNNNNNINNINNIRISPYVQGMNILVAPFLYISKSEPEAFSLFHSLLTNYCPLYVTSTIEGVHTGSMLVDIILKKIDPKLHSYLNLKLLKTEIYAFPSVLTLCACTPPLNEVLILWDFLFSYGIHMNILFIVAQLILIRNDILQSSSPMKLLRNFPNLKSKQIIKLSISFITKLSDEMYQLLVKHPYDSSVKFRVQSLLKKQALNN
ncbi:Bub2p [Ascoidea rubescens DSM 1968]|uniref:TBC-domain-containing protein n=1 Tax=Ascoidea rubescens DSM 1968 TaxID=1344418 RepID=A0A1D2VKV6_9ASCO|nr:TBC-domain-containing protein [Ascoidea rubescens DSM 1968]ODV62236.1 TBC-domain-containing protein [Ascoidea rubescens DSM 1968]